MYNQQKYPMVRRFIRRSKKVTLYTLAVTLLTATLGAYGSYVISTYFDNHKWEFRSPIQSPVVISKRIQTVALAETVPLWQQLQLTGIEKDICVRFGTDCRLALAISKAENRDHRCDYVNKNKNGSVDVGLFQINTIHFD
ncbi:MAG: hypothetical protein HY973_02835, partial [Candidatus Kerfeldbacteria bacterium]|nr:hypothetical protein [Candidatus Kerfeldbacteria bacterium]